MSDNRYLGFPNKPVQCIIDLAASIAVVLCVGNRTVNLGKQSVMVTVFLLPNLSFSKGPIVSIDFSIGL